MGSNRVGRSDRVEPVVPGQVGERPHESLVVVRVDEPLEVERVRPEVDTCSDRQRLERTTLRKQI